MQDNFILDDLNDKYAKGVISLFINNYKNYHYDNLIQEEGISNLLNQDKFKGIVISAKADNKVIGFAGYYMENNESKIVFKLAHLLVEKEYRGLGIGSILEEKRLERIKNYNISTIIYASCVENPPYSILLKKNRGFIICGVRVGYRPGECAYRDNSIIMALKIQEDNYINDLLEYPLKNTRTLICNSTKAVKFISGNSECNYYYKYVKKKDQILSRCEYDIHYDEDGEDIDEIIKRIVSELYEYVSVKFSPKIKGFKYLDDKLQKNNILPMIYLPNSNDLGSLEYQFFKNKKILDIILCDEGMDFLKKVYDY